LLERSPAAERLTLGAKGSGLRKEAGRREHEIILREGAPAYIKGNKTQGGGGKNGYKDGTRLRTDALEREREEHHNDLFHLLLVKR